MKPKISMIIPNYNGEKYVGRCLDSILRQNYPNIEIIVIDDGSRDGSGDILKKYREKSGITVIFKKNGGVSSARNCGIDAASGEYICFADSDDELEENALSTMCDQIADRDLLIFSYSDYLDSGRVIPHDQPEEALSGDKLRNQMFYYASRTFLFCPWNKLYRASVLKEHNVRFPGGIRTGEDFIFNMSAARYVSSVRFINAHLYRYHRNENSASSSVSPERWKAQCEMIRSVYALHPESNSYEAEFIVKRELAVFETYIHSQGLKGTAGILRNYWQETTADDHLKHTVCATVFRIPLSLSFHNHFVLLCMYDFLIYHAIMFRNTIKNLKFQV